MGYVLLALSLALATLTIVFAADQFGIGGLATTGIISIMFAATAFALRKG